MRQTVSNIASNLSGIHSISQNDKQKKYYIWQLEQLKPCEVEEYTGEIKFKPILKGCFQNATQFSFQTGAKYVEGYFTCMGMPLHHAWNLLDGKYYDITTQYFANEPEEKEYGSIIEISTHELTTFLLRSQTYGNIIRMKYLEDVEDGERERIYCDKQDNM